MSKYGAKQTTVDNIRFHSKAEAAYYNRLKLLKRAGEITDFSLQPEYLLIDKYVNAAGSKIRSTHYKADFLIVYPDGREEIIDVKGHRTAEYKLKKKMFESKYPLVITEVQA